MKRILHVISSLEQGGMEAVVVNYFNNIDREKVMFDFLVIYGARKGFYEDYLIANGCKVFKMLAAPEKYFAHGNELKLFFAAHNYEIVHIHAMSSLRYRVAKAAKKSGVKNVIYHSHNSSGENNLFFHKLLQHKLEKWCDYKFACSNAAGKYMYKGEFKLIQNAIDLEHFAYCETARREIREEYGLADKFVVGNIGRLTTVKNQLFLLKVMLTLVQRRSNAVLFLIGEGAERKNLEKFVNDNDLSDNVIFAGTVGEEVYKYYSAFDYFAVSSHFEGLSMVLVEAQANGLPIVASVKLSKEHRQTENFSFLPIDDELKNYNEWAGAINQETVNRVNNQQTLMLAGYDIKIEARKLQNFYLSL